jgi:hypothetical protein
MEIINEKEMMDYIGEMIIKNVNKNLNGKSKLK